MGSVPARYFHFSAIASSRGRALVARCSYAQKSRLPGLTIIVVGRRSRWASSIQLRAQPCS